jgi:hypothetical protein
MTETQPLAYEDAVRIAEADPAVVGLFLIGSQSMEGLPTEHSDHDLFVITAEGEEAELARLHGMRSSTLDLNVVPLNDLLGDVLPEYTRYALARSRVVLDRTGGAITEFLAAKGRLDERKAFADAAEHLDAYQNMLYRSVKNHRDGRALASRLDAAESVGYLLNLLFTLELRPRPYNKALEWELERHPLRDWDSAALLDAISRITATGDTTLQRQVFAQVEPLARNAGHEKTLDEWGDDLLLMRPAG